MDALTILNKHYQPTSDLYQLIYVHSLAVASKARDIALKQFPGKLNDEFVFEAALLHDIGMKFTNAPELYCHGEYPYLCHGYLGHDLLLKEGLPKHALVCERHTGTGLSLSEIREKNLPLPDRALEPLSLAEKLICYCDKFYSKSGDLTTAKPVEQIAQELSTHGNNQTVRFEEWHQLFGNK